MALEQEIETFRRALPALLADPTMRGKFALVHGDTVAAVLTSQDAALEAGYEKFGLSPFLVKEVTDSEEPQYFSRSIRWPS